MRLIDADELMEKFKEWIPKCGSKLLESGIHPVENIAVSALMEIEEAPTIEAEPKWILCSERLPEVNKKVLVTYEKFNGKSLQTGFDKRIITKGGEIWQGKGTRVLAWMPLPPAYKGE